MNSPRCALMLSLLTIAGTAVACPPEPSSDPAASKSPAAKPAERITQTNEQLRKDSTILGERELAQKKQVAQRDIASIRFRNFTSVTSEAVRAQGIEKLRTLAADPMNLPLILEAFSHDDAPTRRRIVDMIAGLNTQAGDSTIGWTAMTDSNAEIKAYAMDRVRARTEMNKGEVPYGVQCVIAAGLDSNDNKRVGSAANMALTLGLYDAIPAMISAQVRSNRAGTGNAALAQIVIATQRAFVRDLTPVVGENTVGFDPEIGVVTEGVILRVMDAVVMTYHTEVHHSLQQLAERGMPGQPVASFGYDQAKWMKWHDEVFLPYRESLKAKAMKAAETDKPAEKTVPVAKPDTSAGTHAPTSTI